MPPSPRASGLQRGTVAPSDLQSSPRTETNDLSAVVGSQSVTLPPTATLQQGAAALKQSPDQQVRIVDQDKCVGVLTTQAVLSAISMGADPVQTPLSSCMVDYDINCLPIDQPDQEGALLAGSGFSGLSSRWERYLNSLVLIQSQIAGLRYQTRWITYDTIVELLGQATEVSRVYVFENHQDDHGHWVISQRVEWCNQGVPAEIDNPALQNMAYQDFLPRWYPRLLAGQPIMGHVRNFPPEEQELFHPQGIQSLLVVPMRSQHHFYGFVGFDACMQERIWQPEDIHLLKAVASSLTLALEQQHTQRTLAETQTAFATVFQCSPDFMAILTFPEGRFLEINTGFAQFLGFNRGQILGRSLQQLNRLTQPSPIGRWIHHLRRDGVLRDQELEILTACGEVRTLLLSCERIEFEGQRAVLGVAKDITDRKRMETALRVSEARFRAVFQQTDVGICRADLTGTIVEANPGLCRLLGYTPTEITQKTFQDLTHPDDLSHDLVLYEQLLTGKQTAFSLEKRYLHKNGTAVWVMLTVCLVGEPQQDTFFTLGIVQDISDLKRTELALRRSEERYALATSESRVGVWDWDLVSGEMYISPNLKALLGYGNDEIDNTIDSWSSLIFAADRTKVKQAMQAHLKGRSTAFEVLHRMVHREGSLRWILTRGHVFQDAEGLPVRMAGTDADVTELQQVEQALRESHHRIADILESITDAFFALDDQFRFIYVNQRAEQLLQCSRQQLLGKTIWDEFPLARQMRFFSEYRRVMEQRVSSTFEEFYPPFNCWFEVHAYPTQDGLAVYFQDISDRKRIETQLYYDAHHDALTGIPNRATFVEQLETAVKDLAFPSERDCAVLFIDLDRFKVVNDSLGHLVGDQLLIDCAKRLQAIVRHDDLVARLGGDEFAVLLRNIDDNQDCIQVAQRIHEALRTPFILQDREIFVGASIGIASSLTGAVEAVDFLRDADTAMYQAKNKGRSCLALFDASMYEQVTTQLTLENDLQRAIQRQDFSLQYQPIVDLQHGILVGFEALLRWHHARWGTISPSKFIPLAEETGQIIPLGQWTLQAACQQLHQWQLLFPQAQSLSMSVNLSVKQFSNPALLADIDAALLQSHLLSRHLRLEITESALMDNDEQAAAILEAVRERGIQLCIDDFGTGYSSLSMVHRFPVQILKIDRSFISQLDTGERGLAMIQAILALASSLGMAAIAEGVETLYQLHQLQALNCPLAQGYWFAPPLTIEKATEMIQAATEGQTFFNQIP